MFSFSCKAFNALTAHELYQIMQARSEVFVVEQNCPYQDADGKDLKAHHFVISSEGVVAAYTRLLPPGVSYPEMSIGRVLTTSQFRNSGHGKILMERSITECRRLFGQGNIVIGAQYYLKRFYESFGFVQEEDIYLEDNIEHIKMRLL